MSHRATSSPHATYLKAGRVSDLSYTSLLCTIILSLSGELYTAFKSPFTVNVLLQLVPRTTPAYSRRR